MFVRLSSPVVERRLAYSSTCVLFAPVQIISYSFDDRSGNNDQQRNEIFVIIITIIIIFFFFLNKIK